MHSRIWAWKIISGVLTGQPCDRPLPWPYSSMQVESGTGLAGVPPPANGGGGRLRRSSVSFGSGGSGGAPHSRLAAVLRFSGSHMALAISLIASSIRRPAAPPRVSFGGGKYLLKRVGW